MPQSVRSELIGYSGGNLVLLEFFSQRTTVDPQTAGGTGLVVVTMSHDCREQGFFDLAENCFVKVTGVFAIQIAKVFDKCRRYRFL